MTVENPTSSTRPSPPIYKPINSSKYEIRLLHIPFSMLRNLGQEDSKPLSGRLVHHTLPLGSSSIPKKFVQAVTRRAYTALSYVWGDPSPTNEIIIDGHSVRITHSLYSALRQLQSDAFGEESIWVDALCINQADDAEKSAQIRVMREVYHNAGSVRVWLGPASGESDQIYDCMHLIQALTNGFMPDKYKDSHEWWEANLLPLALRPLGLAAHTTLSGWHKINMFTETFQGIEEERKAQLQILKKADWEKFYQDYVDWRPRPKDLEKFLQLVPNGDLSAVAKMIEKYIIVEPEWFSRIWVVQEVGVGWEDIDVCRGPYNMSWDNLLNVIFYLHFTCNVPFPSIDKVMGLEVIRQGFREGKRRRLRDLMYDCRYRRASDPRDKIYGLFGLMGDQVDEFIRPDYSKSIEEVYTHATFHFIAQARSLDPICGQQKIGRREGLPSWVPDYELDLEEAPDALVYLDGTGLIFHASGYDERSNYVLADVELSLIEWSILHTQGLRIGRVDFISDDAGRNETFGTVQGRWRKALDQYLETQQLEVNDLPTDCLDAIGESVYHYSAYSTSLTESEAGPRSVETEDISTPANDANKIPENFEVQKELTPISNPNRFVLSYLNVLTTGRSTATTRVSPPSIPPFPTTLPLLPSLHNQSEPPLLPTKSNGSSTSLISKLHKGFGSSRPASERVISSASSTSTPTDDPPVPLTPLSGDGKSSQVTAVHQALLATCAHLDSCMRRKKFFVTSEGNLGSGPEQLREGDEVVVLFGCSVPVILRQVGGNSSDEGAAASEKRWEFVGEAFVDGFMDAEALAWLVRGRFKVEDFVLI